MHAPSTPSMVSLHEAAALLQSRMPDLLMASDAYVNSWVVKIISWFFITLALSMGLPIILLVVFDFFLWIYRLVFPSITPANVSSRARRRPDASTSKATLSSSHNKHPITAS